MTTPRSFVREVPQHSLSALLALALQLPDDVAAQMMTAAKGSLRTLGTWPAARIEAEVAGMTPKRCDRVLALIELARRYQCEVHNAGSYMRGPADVAAYFAPRMQDLVVEELRVAILNAQHRIERDILITRGLLTSSLCHPREVFREAIAESAAAVIIVRNHPSGDPTPSNEDRTVTAQLVSAGKLLDIPVHDHIIIGRGRYMSFAEAGLL